MQKIITKLSFLLLLLAGSIAVAAQSSTTRSGTFDASGVTEYSQYLYIAPGAHITIPAGQQWVISSQYVFIDPSAVIDGGGKMIIDDPAHFGNLSESVAWAGQPTTVDGGNSKILANVVNRNPGNIILGAVAIGPSFGDITTANTDHTFYIGTSFDYALTHADGTAITGNDVILGNNDFRFATTATQTGYRESRFAVTNGNGHVVKDAYTGAWTFPVGIAEGDYTPASITNSGTPNAMHVLVQNYATSVSLELGLSGIDRTWNIYASNATGNSIVDLQHNRSTSQSSFGTATSDNTHFVTRYSGIANNHTGDGLATSHGPWQSNIMALANASPGTLTTGTSITNATERSRTYTDFATTATDPIAYYSKSSDPLYPLPIRLASFKGTVRNCTAILSWISVEEQNISYIELQRSTGGSYATINRQNPKGNNSVYSYTDAAAPNGNLLYRLRIVDKDGIITFSDVVSLRMTCGNEIEITAYPNPVKEKVTVSGLGKNSLVKLVNDIGQVLTAVVPTNSILDIDMTRFPKATYILYVIQDDTIVKSIKLLKN